MLSKLIRSLGKSTQARAQVPPIPAPDISRVIRPPAPSTPDLTSDTLLLTRQTSQLAKSAEEAVASLADEFEGWMRKDLAGLCQAWETARQPDAGADAYRA